MHWGVRSAARAMAGVRCSDEHQYLPVAHHGKNTGAHEFQKLDCRYSQTFAKTTTTKSSLVGRVGNFRLVRRRISHVGSAR